MADLLPELYFRIRENGAAVFRVDSANRQGRIEMEQIAVAKVRNGEVKPQGGSDLTEAEAAKIADWIAARQDLLAARGRDEILQTVDRLNLCAQWAQSKATDAELEEITNDLLVAMHDLRTVLVRKKAERQG